jgi:hypothetical protein
MENGDNLSQLSATNPSLLSKSPNFVQRDVALPLTLGIDPCGELRW